jgi:methylglutamate dehydrogenase subunit D
VPRPDLVPRSAIELLLRPGHHGAAATPAGVTLALKPNVALAMVMARNHGVDDLTQRVRSIFGLELPTLPRRVGTGALACAWAGPGQWLFMADGSDPLSFEATMREKLGGLAAVSNQSDGRTILRAAGPSLLAMLAKGVPIDLHPRSFKPGDVAMTGVGHIAVHLSLLDEAPTCELLVFRSFAASLWEWLLAAGAEFGVEVIAES